MEQSKTTRRERKKRNMEIKGNELKLQEQFHGLLYIFICSRRICSSIVCTKYGLRVARESQNSRQFTSVFLHVYTSVHVWSDHCCAIKDNQSWLFMARIDIMMTYYRSLCKCQVKTLKIDFREMVSVWVRNLSPWNKYSTQNTAEYFIPCSFRYQVMVSWRKRLKKRFSLF